MSLTEAESEKLADMLGAIEAEMGALSDWERGFMKDQLNRHAQYGSGIRLSTKQWAMIRRVYEKVTGDAGETPPPDESEEDRDYE